MPYDPSRTAVVVVDMQNGFCHPDGSLYAEPSEAAIDPVSTLVDRAHDAGVQVVYTRDVHPPEQFDDAHYYDEFDRWGEHVVEGSWEAELVDSLDVHSADHVVEKHTYDAFHQTELGDSSTPTASKISFFVAPSRTSASSTPRAAPVSVISNRSS